MRPSIRARGVSWRSLEPARADPSSDASRRGMMHTYEKVRHPITASPTCIVGHMHQLDCPLFGRLTAPVIAGCRGRVFVPSQSLHGRNIGAGVEQLTDERPRHVVRCKRRDTGFLRAARADDRHRLGRQPPPGADGAAAGRGAPAGDHHLQPRCGRQCPSGRPNAAC